jgi:hypothetical protein
MSEISRREENKEEERGEGGGGGGGGALHQSSSFPELSILQAPGPWVGRFEDLDPASQLPFCGLCLARCHDDRPSASGKLSGQS